MMMTMAIDGLYSFIHSFKSQAVYNAPLTNGYILIRKKGK